MNTPNPLVPQGSLLDKGKSHFRITVFATLGVHVVLLCVLLIAGCNKKTDQTADTGLAPQVTEAQAWPTSAVPPPPPPSPVTQDVVVVPPPPPYPDPVVPPVPVPGQVPDQPVGAGTEHTIVKGETYATIGKKYGVGYKAIEAANPGISPTRLKIGDKIKIPPPKSPSAGLGTSRNGTGADGTKTYKVKSGDNLGKIGKAYGVTPKQLRAANNLKTDQIKVGQILKIPDTATAPAWDPTAPPPGAGAPPVPPPGLPPP